MAVFTHHLAQRFQTFAPDLRGYGRSTVRHSFAMTAHLGDLEALIERYHIQRCLIVGWSLGGILALELALRLGDRCSGLILVASAARPVGNHPPVGGVELLNTGLTSLINWLWPKQFGIINRLGRRSLYRYLIHQHTPSTYRYLAEYAVPAHWQTSAQATTALQTALRSRYDRRDVLAQIHQPCLVLAGAGDRHITAASSQETATLLPRGHWQCYPDVAHLFPWEIPLQVLQDIDHWLDQHPEVIALRT
jgi:proline iminopeptidase